MEDLLNIDEDNTGGLQLIRFTPIRFLSSFNPLIFISGRTWINIYCTTETGRLSEQTETDSNGDFQNVSITCSVPKIRKEITGVLEKYRNEPCIVDCQDNNDTMRRVGTWAGQVRLLDQSDTGAAAGDLNAYTVQFKGKQLKSALFI